MAILVTEPSGRQVDDAAPELAHGGEARILAAPFDPAIVAKIFSRPDPVREAKLRAMIANPPVKAGAFPALVWPLELLRHPTGAFAGYTMPRAVSTKPLAGIRHPSERRKVAPDFTYKHMVSIACNIANAFELAHARGYVVGDVSDKNVLVRPDCRVMLIDADSFQVETTDELFLCTVVTPEFAPPELRGADFRTEVRKPSADAFGLAILTYYLVMEGFHPFQGRSEDSNASSLDELISIGSFAHADNPRGAKLHPPPAAPPFDILSSEIQKLFRRAFDEGILEPSTRPGPTEWKRALEHFRDSLVACTREPKYHAYPGHLGACCWCSRAEQLNFDLYLPETVRAMPKRQASSPQLPSAPANRTPTSVQQTARPPDSWHPPKVKNRTALWLGAVATTIAIAIAVEARKTPSECARTDACKDLGRCTPSGWSCVLASDADCRLTAGCLARHACTLVEGIRCAVGPNDCAPLSYDRATERCVAVKAPAGGYCAVDADCAHSDKCRGGRCGPQLGVAGATCHLDADCSPGLSCWGDGSRPGGFECRATKPQEPKTCNSGCATAFVCEDGACIPRTRKTSGGCSSDGDCISSLKCLSDSCRKAKEFERCDNDAQCNSGLRCSGSGSSRTCLQPPSNVAQPQSPM